MTKITKQTMKSGPIPPDKTPSSTRKAKARKSLYEADLFFAKATPHLAAHYLKSFPPGSMPRLLQSLKQHCAQEGVRQGSEKEPAVTPNSLPQKYISLIDTRKQVLLQRLKECPQQPAATRLETTLKIADEVLELHGKRPVHDSEATFYRDLLDKQKAAIWKDAGVDLQALGGASGGEAIAEAIILQIRLLSLGELECRTDLMLSKKKLSDEERKQAGIPTIGIRAANLVRSSHIFGDTALQQQKAEMIAMLLAGQGPASTLMLALRDAKTLLEPRAFRNDPTNPEYHLFHKGIIKNAACFAEVLRANKRPENIIQALTNLIWPPV